MFAPPSQITVSVVDEQLWTGVGMTESEELAAARFLPGTTCTGKIVLAWRIASPIDSAWSVDGRVMAVGQAPGIVMGGDRLTTRFRLAENALLFRGINTLISGVFCLH